jgi:two-component system response regulator DevR
VVAYNGSVQGFGSKTVRVFLLDDHDIVRRGLLDLLAPANDIVVVGESGSAERALDMIPDLKPDVMLLDVHLQDGTGIEVCRRVRSADPAIHGLLLTSAGDDEALIAAILADAAGYLIKLTGSSRVLRAVRRVGVGKSMIDRDLRQRAIERLRAELIDTPSPSLPAVERDVVSCLLDGASNAEIAERTGLPVESVERGVGSLVQLLMGMTAVPPLPPATGAGRHRRPDGPRA